MTKVPDDLVQALAGRYEPTRELGRGGMATVYAAHDRRHQREVALKVLRPDLAATLGAERFLKEISIAARLTHPHILSLHDSGQDGGYLWYVMPLLEGGSLRNRLDEHRRLELDEALAIAAPVADALGYAHRMGVYHRDIKPENILFSQGHPIVADFGIAKAIITAGTGRITRTGFPVGTPGYMSPEQAAGLTDLDERTDVYALAAVVYEMLVGEIPAGWPMDESVRGGRFMEAPPSHRSRLAQVGAVTEGALVRAMAIRHADRTATPSDLMSELAGRAAPARRRFKAEEVDEIVGRAAQMEATQSTVDGALTIGGVEQLAEQVGIPKDLVRKAAADLRGTGGQGDRGTASRATPLPAPNTEKSFWAGAPLELFVERVVEGELPDDEFSTVVEEIRTIMRMTGGVSQLGKSFTWVSQQPQGSTRNVQVAVTVRGGVTRIVAHEHLGGLAGAIFGGVGGGVGGGGIGLVIGVVHGLLGFAEATAGMLVPFWIAGVLASTRSIYYYATKKRDRKLNALADRLAALVGELIPERGRLRPAVDDRRLKP